MLKNDSVPFKQLFSWASLDTTGSITLPGIDSISVYALYPIFVNKEVRSGLQSKKNYVLYVTGIRRENKKRVVLLDTDNDGSLSDEKIFEIGSNTPFLQITNLQYDNPVHSPIHTVHVKPHINNEMKVVGSKRKPHPKEVPNLGAMVRPIYRLGEHTFENGTYKFALFNYFEKDYSSEFTFLVVVHKDASFPSPNAAPVYYQKGDVFYIENNGYVFKDAAADGSSITLRRLKPGSKHFGADSGLYAYPFQGADLRTGKRYELGKEDKYVVLDFWGTWCGPCLKLTPDLKELNDLKSKYKFNLVSVAYDRDVKAVKNHIESQGIYWTNIFDDIQSGIITKKYKVDVFPTLLLIDKKGKVVFRGAGKEGLDKIKQKLMQQ